VPERTRREPAFGFAPALSVTLWLVIAVYLIESRSLPLPGVRRSLAVLGLVAVALALLFPVNFAADAVALGAAAHRHRDRGLRAVRRGRAARGDAEPRRPPDAGAAARRYRRRGRVRPAAAAPGAAHLPLRRRGLRAPHGDTARGWWFAPWQWTHKTVFSLLAWIVFAALLAGRRVFGWRGPLATRWLYAGAGLLLLAYVGSRFVFEVVLHRPPTV
jgi:hypothetical protein